MHTLNIPVASTQVLAPGEFNMHTLYIQNAHYMHTEYRSNADYMHTPYISGADSTHTKCILAHTHLLVVGPERPAVNKLLAKEVLVPDVKAAEDLNLRPLATAAAALGTRTLLHAPHQPPNLTFEELIVLSVGYRQPEPIKPIGTAEIVQEVGQFAPKVLENRMLHDVGRVFGSRFGGANGFAQGSETIPVASI